MQGRVSDPPPSCGVERAGPGPAPAGASILVRERRGAVDDGAEDAEAEHEILAILFLLGLLLAERVLLAQTIGLCLRRGGLVLCRRVAVRGPGVGGLAVRGLVRLGFGLSLGLHRRGRLALAGEFGVP